MKPRRKPRVSEETPTSFVHSPLISKETQTELLNVAFRRPSRTDIKDSDYVGLPELGDTKIFEVDEGEAATACEDFLARWVALPKADSKVLPGFLIGSSRGMYSRCRGCTFALWPCGRN